jgi:hypothetical protein
MADTATATTMLDERAGDEASDPNHYKVKPAELVRHGEVVHSAVGLLGDTADTVGKAGAPAGGSTLTGDPKADTAFTKCLNDLSYALRTLGVKIDSVAGKAADCATGYRAGDGDAAERYSQCVLRVRK